MLIDEFAFDACGNIYRRVLVHPAIGFTKPCSLIINEFYILHINLYFFSWKILRWFVVNKWFFTTFLYAYEAFTFEDYVDASHGNVDGIFITEKKPYEVRTVTGAFSDLDDELDNFWTVGFGVCVRTPGIGNESLGFCISFAFTARGKIQPLFPVVKLASINTKHATNSFDILELVVGSEPLMSDFGELSLFYFLLYLV